MKDASDVEPPTRPDASPDHLDIKHSSTRLSTFARSAKRYIASFRGRTVQGLDVPVPEGYRGLVLEVEKSTRPTANSAVNRAKKRVVESSAMNTEAPETPKSLKAIGEFPSFVVWSPDIPVNETRDKYLTAMAEWAFLAEQVRFLFPFLGCLVPHFLS
jgi:ribonuclease H2 subunit C